MGIVLDIRDLAGSIFSLTKDVGQTKTDIKEMRADIHKPTLAVQMLSNKIEGIAQHEASERKIIKLELENALLKQSMLPKKSTDEPDR